jgi:signal transduction histidine kinase/CheY-like chemotaxis protein
MVVMFGVFSAVIVLIVRIVEQASPVVTIFMAAIIVLLSVGFVLINRFNIYRYAIPVVIITLGDVIFPILFFLHGGSDSGMSMFYIIPALTIFVVAHGWLRIFLFLLQAAVVIFCYGVALQPDPIIAITPITAQQSFVDIVLSWVVAGAFIGFVALFQRLIYEKEKERADDAIESVSHLVEMRGTINTVATILLTANEDNKGESFEKSLQLLAEGFAVDTVKVWRLIAETNHSMTISLFDWYSISGSQIQRAEEFTAELPKSGGLVDLLSRNKSYLYISADNPQLPEKVSKILNAFQMGSSLVLPIITHENLWGFVTFSAADSDRELSHDEAEAMHSAVMILSEAIVLQQTFNDLVSAREQALLGLKTRSNFLANMSHEVRTPISAIIGMTNLALADDDLAHNKDRLNKIKEASTHLIGVINDILDMSKIEAGKFNLHIKPFYTKAMIDRTLSMIRFRTEERFQTLTSHIDPQLPERLIGDEQHIVQVIMNLLSNAIKFTPEEGAIEFRCEVISLGEKMCTVKFSVIDDGIGIDPEKQEKLFDSFEQIESGTTRQYSGTGLGLPISKNIVESMGGTLEVESSLGKGSTFKFAIELPIYLGDDLDKIPDRGEDKEVEAFKELIDKRMLDLSQQCILVAEDIDINFEILDALLEPTGIKLEWAHNGREAVEMYTNDPTRYDLILMDLQMPEMNGFDATREIRSSRLSNAKQIPIIAMTANVLADDIASCYQCSMNGHLGKPLDIIQLISTLKHHLGLCMPQ